MEEVKDIPAKIPPLALYPPQNVQLNLSPDDWQGLLDTWLFCIEYRLRLKDSDFAHFKLSQNASGVSFLLSYLRHYEQRIEAIKSGSKEAKLHHQSYVLLKRILLGTKLPYDASPADFFILVGSGSIAFHAIPDWKSTLRAVWKQSESQVKAAIDSQRSVIIKSSPGLKVEWFRRLSALIKCLPESAVVAVIGSDYLETITESYNMYSPDVQRSVTEHIYHGLRSLMLESHRLSSLLLDVLFDLKSGADRISKGHPQEATLLSSLICTTPFLRHLESDASMGSGKRGQLLVDSLSEYRQNTLHLHPLPAKPRRSTAKGKGKAIATSNEEMHIHKASKISQVHELFPDLPNGYILRLLDHFSDDVEALIAALLEPDSLPADLRTPTQDDEMQITTVDNPPDLAPRSTPPLPPQRKNIFDGDEFDRLQISSERIHKGRKEMTDSQTVHEQSRSKAAILAALAAFDADDDERDDTYDVADVGGAVDNTLDSDERRNQDYVVKNEEALWRAWLSNPEMFGRDSTTRLSKARRQLCEDTNMGNEQIEGWAIMLKRDPKLEEKLHQRYSVARTFQGNQRTVQSTKWRANESPSESQDEGGNTSDGRRVGQAGIRGPRTWNRGRGRGGGSTAGPADEKATQLARRRKEQGRGRGGAAHNRREGRAKKIGRGMGPVTAT